MENDVLASVFEYGVASLALPGQDESGDLHVVARTPSGALIGVVDGLGHGAEAAVAARIAVGTMEQHAHESVMMLVQRCHEYLKATRGVVMSLASINAVEKSMTWLSIGNIEGVLLRANKDATPAYEVTLQRGGVVGYRLPQLYASVVPVMRDDVLIFSTDGIRNSYIGKLNVHESPQQLADSICSRYGRGTDDALVLVAKYRGAPA